MKYGKIAASLLAAALLAGCMAGCGGGTPSGQDAGVSQTAGDTAGKKAPGQAGGVSAQTLPAQSYDEVLSALRDVQSRQQSNAANGTGGPVNDGEAGTVPTPQEAGAAEDPEAGTEKSVDYSDTNMQVAGIDEGDVVKTDGSYLYILRDSEVTILKAAGADTAEVGKVAVCENDWSGNSGEYAQSMYVEGDVLIVITQRYQWSVMTADGTETAGVSQQAGDGANRTHVKLYDISDRAAPKLTGDLVQDGCYQDSRETGGILYLVGNYDVYDFGENSPEEYVPCAGEGDSLAAIPAEKIYLCPQAESTSYAVISSVDVAGGKFLSTQAVLGGAGTVYMNMKNLYLTSTHNEVTASEPYEEKQYQVVNYTCSTQTLLHRFALDGGKVDLQATGTVPGYLLNQFSLDEYDGYLRLATTDDSYIYQIYTDPVYDFSNYKEGDTKSASSIYVLDSDLGTVGTLGPFADDERIYSVRFDGTVGYVVTFRETDPLFAVDLSDPAKPAMRSELKLTGFSDYLHLYGEGRMLGLGMEADAQTGETSGMKLSMFDVTDPVNVKEITSVRTDDSGSEALYNHKAILLDVDKGLIAFPGDGRYLVYSYSEDGGFVRKGAFDAKQYSEYTRGLYIGDFFYICSPDCVTVASMDTLEQVQDLEFVSG